MVECGICLEEYQEGGFELHQETCVVRLIFRCSLCAEDYVSKEGLWNHLDWHEVAYESKDLHYQEIKAKHKLHQCALCNDQRAYSESSYWKHVHDVHDGFFLRCSDCGENFRSEELMNAHASTRCYAMDQTVASDFNILEEEPVPFAVGHLKLSQGKQSSNAHTRINNQMSDNSRVSLSTANDKESDLSASKSRFTCDICEATFSSNGILLRHKRAKYSCIEGRRRKCPHCWRIFQKNEYLAHFSSCEKRKFSCGLYPVKTQTTANLVANVNNRPCVKGDADKTQEKIMEKSILSASDSSSSSHVSKCSDINTAKKDTAENSSIGSSDIKCMYCVNQYGSAALLRHHILHCHKPTKCSICGITFLGSAGARYHKIKMHTQEKYECVRCSKKFHIKQFFERHSAVCNPIQIDFSSSENSGEITLIDRSDSKLVTENPASEAPCTKCSHCGIEESSFGSLARHILIHHDPVACDFCGITLPNLSQAQLHTKTNHRKSKYRCPHCSMQFRWRVSLINHVSNCENEKVPCDLCGKMFEDLNAVNRHRSKTCHAYKRNTDHEQKHTEMSERDETDSSTAIKKISPFPNERGLSQTKCYFCNEEFPSPGHLTHHLKIHHELTKCDICGITIIGISESKHHKIICHKEPNYECRTCGMKFHHKRKYDAHSFLCEHKRYLCKQCGRTFKVLKSIRRHCKAAHSVDSSLKNIQIITVDKSTISTSDSQNQSTKDGVPNSRSNEHSIASLADDGPMDSEVIDNECPIVSAASFHDSIEMQVVSEGTMQPLVEKASNHPHSCVICGITFVNRNQFRYHKLTEHTEPKFQCPHCSRKFHKKRRFEDHVSSCADLKHACELCGQRFDLPRYVQNHKNREHEGNGALRNANIEAVDYTEQNKQYGVDKSDSAADMAVCRFCRIPFTNTVELMKHKLTCPNHAKGHSQFMAEELPQLRDVKESQTNSIIVSQGKNIELNLEIKVEDTMLQEQEYLFQNALDAR